MQLKSCRTLVATVLAGAAVAASAQDPQVELNRDVATVAPSAEQCPAGTIPGGPSYTWENGRLVRNGEVCTSLFFPPQ